MNLTTYSNYTLIKILQDASNNESNISLEDLNELFKEAYERKVCRADVLLSMHAWSLYHRGKGSKPKYKVDLQGNYWKDMK